MPHKPIPIKIRDTRSKGYFIVNDDYLNGFAKHLDSTTSLVYICLCRHVDREQVAFPSHQYMAEKLGISRRTVQEKVKILEDCNLISREKIRRNNGKWLNTTYILVDKSQWKKPWEEFAHGTAMGKKQHSHGQPFPTKGTHTKGTHTNTKVLAKTFGNSDVNKVLSSLKESFALPKLDESEKVNRQYAWHLLRKFEGLDGVLNLIKLASVDEWYKNNITSTKDLFYKGIKIIARKRGDKDGGKQRLVLINPA